MVVKQMENGALEVNWVALGIALKEKVLAKMNLDLETWDGDSRMQSLVIGDAANGLKICEALVEGKWNVAARLLWQTDTAPRDYLYEWLDEITGLNFDSAMSR